MAEPRADAPAGPHAAHDLLLVAARAAGDVHEAELARADAIVAACPECASLASDLQAIATATADLPAAPRTRDFFLIPADAERLRPNGYRRLVAAIAGSRVRLARPLAGGLMTVGLAGLLVAALPGLAPNAATTGLPFDAYRPESSSGTPIGAAGGQSGPDTTAVPPRAVAPLESPAGQLEAEKLRLSRDASSGPSPLVVGSAALVVVGAALFVLTLGRPRRRQA